MKKIITIIFMSLLISNLSSVYAGDLGDFKDDVEQEERENEENQDNNDEYDDSDSGDSNGFMEFLWQITFFLWYAHNETVYYTPYPYESSGMQKGDNFIGHQKINDTSPTKDYFFQFYGGGSFNQTFSTFGAFTRLSGKFFNHLGPELDYRLLYDGSDLFHNVSAGVNISFLQFDYLSIDFLVEGAFFMGILDRQGVSLGAKITSYPFKPVSLEVRSSAMIFPNITFAEIEAKLGFHINRMEIFGNFYTLQSNNTSLYSFTFGAGVHF